MVNPIDSDTLPRKKFRQKIRLCGQLPLPSRYLAQKNRRSPCHPETQCLAVPELLDDCGADVELTPVALGSHLLVWIH